MKSKVLYHIDFETVNILLEGFNKLTGFVTAIEDLEGNILSQSGWREICTEFHRKNPVTAANCKISDVELANKIRVGQKFYFYKCMNGLIDVVVPIVINGEHIANLYTGQFFFEEMDVAFFKNQAKKYGFDEKAYLEALAKVPVFSKEKAEEVMDLLLNITHVIIKMTQEKLHQIEMNEEIYKSKEQLVHSQDLMRYIIEHNRSAVAVHDRDLNYLYVSQRYLDDYKIKDKDIIGKHHYEVFPDLPQKWRDVHQKALKGEISSAAKDAYFREDGTMDWTRWECRPWYEADGTIGGIIIYTEVITESVQAERRLQESEAHYHTLIETTQDGFWVIDINGKITDVNEMYCQMTGYTKTELLGMKIAELEALETQQEIMARIKQITEKKSVIFETCHKRKDGSLFDIEISATFVDHDAGVFVFCRDITKRKKFEFDLRQSEEKFQLLFNKAPLGYQSLDFEGRFIEVNQKWLETLGYSKEEVVGKWFGDFLCPEHVEGFRQRFPIFKSQGYIHSEFEMLHKDGQRLFIAFEGKVGYNADGEFKQTHCILQDITARKQTEEALLKSEERFRIAQEMSPDGFTILHPLRNEIGEAIDFTWVYENQAIARINQTDVEQVIGKSLLDLFPDHVGTSIFEAYKHVANTGESQIIEEINVGGVISRPMWLRLVVVSMGEDIAILSQDVTKRKKTENELLHLSYHDHLTELYNRRFFEEELKRIDRQENLPISIIMCDINGLKMVNDSFGHNFGDELLKNAARTIRKACRDEDVIARIGGDEFVILLPNTTAGESVLIANHIKELASNEKVANIELSISYGYDTKTDDKKSMIETIANAENHMYRHKLHERSSMRSKTIDLIMNTLFEKSNRELLHSNRVSAICKAIATKMNLDKDVINQLGIAGLIHDIGKIGIDEKILNKDGMLTGDEKNAIEKHPEIGWRLLSSTDEFSELGQFVLTHHEKWDGSGYPNGLKGETIPLEARVIVIADAYDAMTNERTYRKEMSKEEAIKELKRCSGTHFDPNIVDVFVHQVLLDNNNFRSSS
ncbi:MAG: PAS domain S-box protein [Dethiosulfatibacter sp.]|nr:PAS domain S-box protein [Dethiosulfatibacter sp.]